MIKILNKLYDYHSDEYHNYKKSIDALSLSDKHKAIRSLLKSNKPVNIVIGVGSVACKLEWNVDNLNKYISTEINKSLLKAICDKLQGEEVNIGELSFQKDEYTNSAAKCVEYIQRRLKVSNIRYADLEHTELITIEYNYGKKGFICLTSRCEENSSSHYTY